MPDAWTIAPSPPTLAPSAVHVWHVSLVHSDASVRELGLALSPEEEFRARQAPFERDRRRFVVCRGLLRRLLGLYLETPAERLFFELGPEGKPALGGAMAGSGLSFNVAHADDEAIIAVAMRRAVGVDLERLRPLADVGPIAEHFFSEGEKRAIAALPGELQLEAFFNCWTRKEAVVKARGHGLAEPLGRIEVSLAPGEPAQLLGIADEPGEAERWSLVSLEPLAGYRGALAAEGSDWRLERYAWRP